MSSTAITGMRKSWTEAPWQLWVSQLLAVLRIELKETLWMRRSIWIYLLAFAPAVMFRHPRAYQSHGRRDSSIEEDTRVLAYTFQIFYLRVGDILWLPGACLPGFSAARSWREEVCHYYFLSPMRREVLVVGSFWLALLRLRLCFPGASVLLCFTFAYGRVWAAGRAFVFNKVRTWPADAMLTCWLRCLHAWALAQSSLRSSLILRIRFCPPIAVLFWESFHSVAPSLLQETQHSFYLKQLCPVTIPPDGLMALFTVMTEPVSPWLAIPEDCYY